MNRNFHDVSPEWTDAVFGSVRLVIKVLIVADGLLTFVPILLDFSLSLFCDVLKDSALPWQTIEVTTAHRHPPEVNTGADVRGFKFDAVKNGDPIFSIKKFDVVWLFGQAGEDPTLELATSEIDAITTFMKNGGGVFATGEHQGLGAALCGKVPRVRRMRRWHFFNLPTGERRAPDKIGATRIDTLRAGLSPGFQAGNQRDNVPQEIRPKFFVNSTGTAAEPHPVLALGNQAITILPDHMHEGECVPPEEIQKKVSNNPQLGEDFPTGSNGMRAWPDVVAVSTSAGGEFFVNAGIVPVEPRCFVAISAYDGHLVEFKESDQTTRLGRIVVDSSFHHFVNVNLAGFRNGNEPDQDFEVFAQYYRNILWYLIPPDKQILQFVHMLTALRFSPPLLEDIQELYPKKKKDGVYAGYVTQNAISEAFSATYARACALAMVSCVRNDDLRKSIQHMLSLRKTRQRPEEDLLF